MNTKQLATSWIMQHEGYRVQPYLCTAGKITIGYGHNCEASDTPVTLVRGSISKEQALKLLEEDLELALKDAEAVISNFDELSATRQAVIIDMAFNLGRNRLSKFKKMKDAILSHQFKQAAFEMLDSTWAVQVGNRATFLARKMEDGI